MDIKEIDVAWGLQKLGIILENKLPPLMKFVKAVTIIFEMQFPWSSLIFPICKINKVDFDKYSTTQLTLMHTYLNFYAK